MVRRMRLQLLERHIGRDQGFLASHLVAIVLASLSPALVLWFPRLIGAIG